MNSALAEEHFPLAVWVARDMARHLPQTDRDSFEDLISCASVALVETASRYDATEGAKFSTYAIPRMRGAVLDELRRNDFASRSVRDGRYRLAKADADLHTKLGRKPTTAELADHLGLTADEFKRLRDDVRRATVIQLDALVSEDGVPFDVPARAPGPEELTVRTEGHRHLRACVDALPAQHREVLARNYFGEESLTVIAADMGLTLSRASQIRARGLALMRSALAHVWDGRMSEATGGIRARREEGEFVARAVKRCREAVA